MSLDIRSSVHEFGRALSAGAKVVDIGCGSRPYEQFFAHCDYVGVDVEVSGRGAEHKRPHVYFNGVDLPFDEAEVDAILCTEVLEHAVDPVRLTAEMRRVLKPGGKVLITVPFMWGEHETPYDFRRYSTYGIRRLLDDAGLHIMTSGKLTCGVDAINALVQSEICNFDANVQPPAASGTARLLRRLGTAVARRTWMMQMQLWRHLYRFERVYIDNVIVATRRDSAAR